MRPLRVVDAAQPLEVMEALDAALTGGGPAVLPRLGGASDSRTAPYEVPDEAALVIETSGSTGRPKRVWLGAQAVLTTARTQLDRLGAPGAWWLVLPTQYIAGVQVLVRSLLSGTPPIVSGPGAFGPEQLAGIISELTEVKKTSALYTAMVPAQLKRLLDAADDDSDVARGLALFDAVLVGGQAVPQPLLEKAKSSGVSVIRTYGSAETAGGCVWDGVALPGVDVREIDGRIAISGPQLAGGYLEDDHLTGKHFVDADGVRWFITDDQGVIGPHGSLTIVGRVDDVIVSGGKKVSLAEVEKILIEDLGASDLVVVAGTHDEWGQVPVIVSEHELDLESARGVIGSRLGQHARPDRIVIVDSLPLLGSGKPDRVGAASLVSQ